MAGPAPEKMITLWLSTETRIDPRVIDEEVTIRRISKLTKQSMALIQVFRPVVRIFWTYDQCVILSIYIDRRGHSPLDIRKTSILLWKSQPHHRRLDGNRAEFLGYDGTQHTCKFLK